MSIWYFLQECAEGSHRADEHHHSNVVTPAADDEDTSMDAGEPTVWLCLQCGHQVQTQTLMITVLTFLLHVRENWIGAFK